MRLRAMLFAGVALTGVGLAAWELAVAATDRVEHARAAAVEEALGAAGQDWASVTADGLEVTVAGIAPDEAGRFRAVAIARQVLNPARIVDRTEARAADPLAPPPFAVEFLRNNAEVSLIGLAPKTGGHDLIRAALDRAGLSGDITDMLETTTLPAPEGFRASLDYSMRVLTSLPRARVTATPEKVTVVAVAENAAAQSALEARLRSWAPAGVDLELEITSPRPVISPFRLAFGLAPGGQPALSACTAETPEAADRLRRAATAPGADCAIGLGAPGTEWAEAAELGIVTVRDLGGGRFELSDAAATLTGAEGAAPDAFAAAGESLRRRLPRGYELKLVAPDSAGAAERPKPPPAFEARRGADGKVVLAGAVTDETSRAAIGSFAAAVFGHDHITDAMVVTPELPDRWPVRVLAGIEALSAVKEGRIAVTPERLSVEGSSLVEDAEAKVQAVFAAKDVGPSSVEVRFDRSAAAALAAKDRPAPQLCADEVSAILASQTIRFAPGSDAIEPTSAGVIAAIADVLRGCPGATFEVAGHTDASGKAEANQALSEARARAVVAALEAEDLPLTVFRARGYGAAKPLADNDSADGRVRNRRIEITLVDPGAEAREAAASGAAGEGPAGEGEGGGAALPADAAAGAGCAEAVAALMADGGIAFGLGSSEIAAESEDQIERIAAALDDCPGASFEVAGHTDDRGSDAGNQRLSEARAKAVRDALVAAGAEGVTIEAVGYGETRPVADNGTSEGRAANRRIEISARAAAPDAAAPDAGGTGAPAAAAPAAAGGNG